MHSQGAYDWFTLYTMPLWLKRFTYNLIVESAKKSQTDSPIDNSVKPPLIPDVVSKTIKSTYSTKLPKS